MIQRAALDLHHDHRDQADYAAHAIGNAPAWARREINAIRARRGLPVVLGRDENRALEVELGRVRRVAVMKAITTTTTRSPRPPATRGSSLPPASRSKPTKSITRVLLTAATGVGRWEGQALREIVQPGAFGDAATINARGFSLVDGHHDGHRVAVAGRGLRAIATDHPDARLVVEWIPDLSDPAHRRLLERIERGEDQVSLRCHHEAVGIQRIPRAARIVKRATIAHLCVLERGRKAAYPGAVAMVFRNKPDTVGELARQIGLVTTSSRRRAAVAGWGD